jgi:hypothetical protein
MPYKSYEERKAYQRSQYANNPEWKRKRLETNWVICQEDY